MQHLKLSNYLLVIVKLEFREKEHFNNLLAWDTLLKIDFKKAVPLFCWPFIFAGLQLAKWEEASQLLLLIWCCSTTTPRYVKTATKHFIRSLLQKHADFLFLIKKLLDYSLSSAFAKGIMERVCGWGGGKASKQFPLPSVFVVWPATNGTVGRSTDWGLSGTSPTRRWQQLMERLQTCSSCFHYPSSWSLATHKIPTYRTASSLSMVWLLLWHLLPLPPF